MKEVVWIVGSSSAGKQTFISRLTQEPELAARFGWEDKKLAICRRSITDVGDLGIPRVVSSRKQIPEDVEKLLQNADVVLIKWQYVDSSCETPQALAERLPNVRHRALVLQAPLEELAQRLDAKDWWLDMGFEDSRQLVGYEISMLDKFVPALHEKLEITRIDSGKGKNYRIVG